MISLAISSNTHGYFNNTFREFEVQKKVITTETYNVGRNVINSTNF